MTRKNTKYGISLQRKFFHSHAGNQCNELQPKKDQSRNEIITPSGLRYTILKTGTGEAVGEGHEVRIYWNGNKLYSSKGIVKPITILVGAGQTMEGVDEGLRACR